MVLEGRHVAGVEQADEDGGSPLRDLLDQEGGQSALAGSGGSVQEQGVEEVGNTSDAHHLRHALDGYSGGAVFRQRNPRGQGRHALAFPKQLPGKTPLQLDLFYRKSPSLTSTIVVSEVITLQGHKFSYGHRGIGTEVQLEKVLAVLDVLCFVEVVSS
jgi:hypothetical protein